MSEAMNDILLTELVLRKLEGVILDIEHERLVDHLSSSDEKIGQYNDLVILHSIFSEQAERVFNITEKKPSPYELDDLLSALAENEEVAPPVEIETEEPDKEKVFVSKIQTQKPTRKISKGTLFPLFAAAAVVLFMFLFVRFAPPKMGVEVATLSGSINARWDEQADHITKGSRLVTDRSSLFLREGMAELLFDNDARILVDSPAEFRIIHDDQIELEYGRIYATVPPQAIGFTVSTPSAKIIDLGTEFGVDADSWGATELHVIKGKTMLLSGLENASKANCEVNQGQAKKVSDVGQVQDVVVKERKFVRRADSETNFVWKGQEVLCLADIFGGGNGLGTGRSNVSIDPLTGAVKRSVRSYERDGRGRFVTVSGNRLIDGVFVPSNNEQGDVVTSNGDRYADFGDTNNKAWIEICNGWTGSSGDPGTDQFFEQGIQLDGQIYGDENKSVLMLHGNSGITFDLDAIRKMLPRLDITKFEALCGIPDHIGDSVADYWAVLDVHVLLDGKAYYVKYAMDTNTGKTAISIPIQRNQRFLTLAITDAGNGNHGDYAVFALPQLILKAE